MQQRLTQEGGRRERVRVSMSLSVGGKYKGHDAIGRSRNEVELEGMPLG